MRSQFLRALLWGVSLGFLSSNAIATELDRAQWLERFEPRVIDQMCPANWYMRQCFTLDAAQCSLGVITALRECEKGFEGYVPPVIRSAAESVRIGGQLAKCVGRTMELQQYHLKRPVRVCRSLPEWEKNSISPRKTGIQRSLGQ